MIRKNLLLLMLLILGASVITSCDKITRKLKYKSFEIGDKVDSLNGIYVYYNDSVEHVLDRNTTADGYNIGLRYQCVEFVKRYYYDHLNHKMPNSYGHAKDFYVKGLADGTWVEDRGLYQYNNLSSAMPQINDLVVYDATRFNKYGHVAIISKVTETTVEIIQQNPGPVGPSRETYKLNKDKGKWRIEHDKILGWLRKDGK